MKKLLVIVLSIFILSLVPGCMNMKKQTSPVSLEVYEAQCRNLTDSALIAEYYQVEVDLQEALDTLDRYQRQLDRDSQQEIVTSPHWNWVQRQTAKNLYKAGQRFGQASGIQRHIVRVKRLRMQKVLILTIIYERGLRPPVS